MTHRSPQQRFVLSVVSAVALAAAVGALYAVVLAPGNAATPPLLAGFEARSYVPGDVATFQIGGRAVRRVSLQFFLAGAIRTNVRGPGSGWDKPTFGKPVSAPLVLRRPTAGTWIAHLRLGANWLSGNYVARLTWEGGSDYAPFVLRPKRLGSAPVLVVESSMFCRLDCGFLRWYWASGYRADFLSDADLGSVESVRPLLHYKLIVLGGHEEHLSSHGRELITQYRDAGGNLAFGSPMVSKLWRRLSSERPGA